MSSELFIAVLGGLAGMLGWGLADFFAKKTIDEIGDVSTLALANIFGTLTFLVIIIFSFLYLGYTPQFPNTGTQWLGVAFFGALQGAVYLFAYKGFGEGQIAVLNPVFASYSGLAALISILALSEVATAGRLVSLAVIFSGIIALSLDLGGLRSMRINLIKTPGLKPVLMAALLASFWTLGWDMFIGGQDWLFFALFMFISMTVSVLAYAKAKKIKLEVKKQVIWKYLFLIGFAEAIAYVGVSLGLGKTSLTSVVALLSGAFSLPTIVLARIFLKEKVARIQTIGTLVIIAGIIMLSIS